MASQSTFGAGIYRLHKAALIPALNGKLPFDWDLPQGVSVAEFSRFLYKEKLHLIWLELLEGGGRLPVQRELISTLKDLGKRSAILELSQTRVIELGHDILTKAKIPYFIAKGAHLRHRFYEKPSQRPAVDIDLFINEKDQQSALEIFSSAGFTAHPLQETLSHELKFTKHNADIDLHWHLMRPGRYRPGLMDWLFERRDKFGDFWGLDATASLLVMLVHPAITKYLISPTSMLIHQVDQARLIASGEVKWEELGGALTDSGMKTAAWSSLYLLRNLGGIEAPDDFEMRIRPGASHAAYLQQWIDRALITNYFEKRRLVAGFFSLALQDSVKDIATALRVKAAVSNPPLPDLS